ncbi:MAG: putative HTH-type transcriptional regulator YusO [Pelotomaculum sp. PtaB.Bin104]|nr:MAG: putative HTH-type transcriptional regulator YusO [Pelotomaculum sp. PtaB.Bin104]
MKSDKLNLYLEYLDEVFQRLARRLHAELAQNMVGGITMSQFIVLKTIKAKGKITVSEVAEDLSVSLSAITALADRLFRVGFVKRQRDEQDRRLVWLTLTGEGEKMVSLCQAARRKVTEKYFSSLQEEDIEQLIKIYEKVLNFIKQES